MLWIPPSKFLPNLRIGVCPESGEVIGDLHWASIRRQDFQDDRNPSPRDGRGRRDAEQIADSGGSSGRFSSSPREADESPRTQGKAGWRHSFDKIEFRPLKPGANNLKGSPSTRKIRKPMPTAHDLCSKHLQVVRLKGRDPLSWEPGCHVFHPGDERFHLVGPSGNRGIAAFDRVEQARRSGGSIIGRDAGTRFVDANAIKRSGRHLLDQSTLSVEGETDFPAKAVSKRRHRKGLGKWRREIDDGGPSATILGTTNRSRD
jgi:hypothetical protein